jgi:uncharacterized membrane protein YeaQ/YmgE (transglycosylase-associated protein family)
MGRSSLLPCLLVESFGFCPCFLPRIMAAEKLPQETEADPGRFFWFLQLVLHPAVPAARPLLGIVVHWTQPRPSGAAGYKSRAEKPIGGQTGRIRCPLRNRQGVSCVFLNWSRVRERLRRRTGDVRMTRLVGLIGATVGSALGWWLGAHIGFMTAFVFSTVGTGAGLYLGRQLAESSL